LKVT
jgi:hypothetical protein